MHLTYPEVGATRRPDAMPRDAHHLGLRQQIGTAACFEEAATFVLGYGMQRGAGLKVSATDEGAAEGGLVTMRVRIGPLRFSAPTQVVYVLHEPDRRGFAYGTLPGHPESGEELFLVERVGDELWAEVRAFSRPGRWYSRLGAPVVSRLQRRYAERYIDAVRQELA